MTQEQHQTGLTISGVTKRFGNVTAVDNVDLDIQPGEFLTLLGPSGSGKTTLLMMIAGFHDISSGDITIDNLSITNTPAEKRDFGMVFQGYALFPHMTVRQNIAYPLDVRKRVRSEIDARVKEMLELVQLEEYGDRLPGELSGGQQQRVALARALCFSPKVLLLDEPLGALDKKLRVDVQAQLKDIHTRIGTTFIYVTHDQEEALSMSDRVVIMNHGKVIQIGTPQELYEKPNSVFAAGFLGKSNFLRSAGKVMALRPEKIEVSPSEKSGSKKKKNVSGIVKSVTYFGSIITLVVETETYGDLEVATDAWRVNHQFKNGQAVDLSWKNEAAVSVAE